MSIMGQCHQCGRPAMVSCRLCGRIVCEECKDKSSGLCTSCSKGKIHRDDGKDEKLFG